LGKLAAYQDLERTTLTRNLEPLEREGLLLVARGHRTDARIKTISITAKGANILRKAIPLWEKAQQEALASLGSPDLAKKLSVIAKEMETH
jgi:DNA-binding MarR family transcriptional regulator